MTLSGLTIGSLDLTPAFDPNETEYTAETTNASDKITATASDSDATVTITSDDATIADDGTATWADGENEVEIEVENGTASKTYTATVSYDAPPSAKLSDLKVGALTLTPTFDPDVTEYAATTSNASNKITATAADADATVVIASDDATIAADGTATWATGENTVTITVTNGELEEVYTVVVTAE